MRDDAKYGENPADMEVFPKGKGFRVVYDPSVGMLRLLTKRFDDFEDIRKAFSVKNKAAFFSQQFGYQAEDRLYSVNKFGYFKPGLFFKVAGWIKTQYGSLDHLALSLKFQQYFDDVLRPLGKYVKAAGGKFQVSNPAEDTGVNDRINVRIAEQIESGEDPDSVKERPFELRYYQSEAVDALFRKGFGRGLIEIPTAGGKSLILATFVWNVLKKVDPSFKTLLLVPNVQLVEQMYKDFVSYGFRPEDLAKFKGGMTKKEKAQNDVQKAKVVIANRQQVFKNPKALPDFDVLVADECHQNCAKASQELIDRSSAKIRIGCSGTLPEDHYQLDTLVGMFGPVVYRENISDLQAEGYISKLDITTVRVFDENVDKDGDLLFSLNTTRKFDQEDPCGDVKFDDAVKAEHEYVVKWFRELYSPALDYVKGLPGNTLVLFDKLDIGRSLYDLFAERNPGTKSFYTDGQTKVSVREDVRQAFEESDGNVLFANVQIMSTGVNIKRLHNLVFCFSSKSTVRVIQSIGRALRLYGDKKTARLIDCVFNFKYSMRHYKERLKLYGKFYNKPRPDRVVDVKI